MTANGSEADEHAVTEPAQWAVLLYEDTALCDVETGEVVREDSVDWNTEDQPDATPEEGLRHAKTVTETAVFTPEYFCLDSRAAGLTPDKWFARNAGMVIIGEDSAVDLDQGGPRGRRAEGPRRASRSREAGAPEGVGAEQTQ